MIDAQFTGFINTAPIWKGQQFEIQQFDFPTISISSFRPKDIPQNLRLGHQMEHVFSQLIAHSKRYNILLHNLQIHKDSITIGEIDFILEDLTSKKLIHVELAYKFYLIDPSISNPIHSLVGPNRRDLFFTKMEKIKSAQFPLLHSEIGAKALSELDIDHSIVEHQSCFKAQIFQAYGHPIPQLMPINIDCIAGYWMRLNDLNTSKFRDAHFYIPSKSEWVISPHKEVKWKSHHEAIEVIQQRLLAENAPLLWVKTSDSEIDKIFVVWW